MKTCSRCRQDLSETEFHFVNRSTGKLRGQCKRCMTEVKALQRDPSWLPSCLRCGAQVMERSGPGRRLCPGCLKESYDVGSVRTNGAHRHKLKPCSLCGGDKERMQRGKLCSSCKPWASYAKSLRLHGITPMEYEALLDSQGGGCAICGTHQRKMKLAIDHDHSADYGREAIRGLLCNGCNYHRLPAFQEKPELLRRAADYLENPPARAVLDPRRDVQVLSSDDE